MKGTCLLLMEAAGLHYVAFHSNALINVITEESEPLDISVEPSIFYTVCWSKCHRRTLKCVISDQIFPLWLDFERSKAQECLQVNQTKSFIEKLKSISVAHIYKQNVTLSTICCPRLLVHRARDPSAVRHGITNCERND